MKPQHYVYCMATRSLCTYTTLRGAMLGCRRKAAKDEKSITYYVLRETEEAWEIMAGMYAVHDGTLTEYTARGLESLCTFTEFAPWKAEVVQ